MLVSQEGLDLFAPAAIHPGHTSKQSYVERENSFVGLGCLIQMIGIWVFIIGLGFTIPTLGLSFIFGLIACICLLNEGTKRATIYRCANCQTLLPNFKARECPGCGARFTQVELLDGSLKAAAKPDPEKAASALSTASFSAAVLLLILSAFVDPAMTILLAVIVLILSVCGVVSSLSTKKNYAWFPGIAIVLVVCSLVLAFYDGDTRATTVTQPTSAPVAVPISPEPPITSAAETAPPPNVPLMPDPPSVVENHFTRTPIQNSDEPGKVYVANIAIDKAFHRSDCPSLKSPNEELLIRDAVKSGYKPCTYCKPLLVRGSAEYQGTHVGEYEKKEHPKPVVVKSLPPIRGYDNTVPGRTFGETNR